MEKTPLLGEDKDEKSDASKKTTVKEQEAEKPAESKQRTAKEESKQRTAKEEETAESKQRTAKEEEVKDTAESKQKTAKESESESEEEEEEMRKGLTEKALNQTLAGTAHLANLLPTGTVLAFQILCPILSNGGNCDEVSSFMTKCLLVVCALSCFLMSFTDSFKGSDGKLHYGFATPKGLWPFESNLSGGVPEPGRYRVGFIDFVHAFLSVLVFAAIALLDNNVVRCLDPSPNYEMKEVLGVLPVTIGVFCSLLFVVFPTTRHGIGYPLTSHK